MGSPLSPPQGGGRSVAGVVGRPAPHPRDGAGGRVESVGQLGGAGGRGLERDGPNHNFPLKRKKINEKKNIT